MFLGSVPLLNGRKEIGDLLIVSPTAVIVYLENIGFVYLAMSMMVIGPSLLY